MIYSKKLQSYIPVIVKKEVLKSPNYFGVTRYVFKDGKIPVGRVCLVDRPNGIYVEMIENYHPDLYGNLTDTAYQLQVEHCMQRGLSNFEILSNASLNSHAIHYLKGKRFIPEGVNEKVASIIKNTPKGEQYNTKSLGGVEMYMPLELIKKYMEIIKKSPLLNHTPAPKENLVDTIV